MTDLDTLRTYAQIYTPLAIIASTLAALYLGLRDRKPRFKVLMRLVGAPGKNRMPVTTIDVRNHGILPVRIKAFYVSGWSAKNTRIPRRVVGLFEIPAGGSWTVRPGDEDPAPLSRLLGENRLGEMWAMWVTVQPPWFHRFPRLAHLFWHSGVVATDGHRKRARLTREAITALRKTR